MTHVEAMHLNIQVKNQYDTDFVFTRIYCSFNDASGSDYAVSNDTMISE
jgi:hypothetical protein